MRVDVKRWLTGAFFVLVAVVFANFARTVDWGAVRDVLLAYPLRTLAVAGGLAALSHLVYSSFDLIGRHEVGHGLSISRSCAITFVSYAFNLNLGSLVGGFATRYRLYTHDGVPVDAVTRILVLSLLTNWLGYAFLGGLVLAIGAPVVSAQWALAAAPLRAIGAVMVVVALAYIAACARWEDRTFRIRTQSLKLPSARVALWQLAVSTLNWGVIASVIYVLMAQQVPYATVLSVLLVAAVAGVITHVPAGLGVLEAVFVTALSGALGQAEIIAALLAYRAVYYLVPLAVATMLFAALEARASGKRRSRRTHAAKRDAVGDPNATPGVAEQTRGHVIQAREPRSDGPRVRAHR